MKKMISMFLALMLCFVSCLAAAETGVIGGADGPTAIVVSQPGFILPGDLEAAALAAGKKGTTTFAVTEVAGISTGNTTLDTALTDLIKALGFTSSVQDGETEFAFTISGTDVLSLGLATSEDDVYVKSNLLGGTVVIGTDEVEILLTRLVDLLVMMEVLTEEDAAMCRDMIASLADVVPAVMQNEVFHVTMTEEDLLALDSTAVTAAVETVLNKAQTTDNPVVPRSCDPAVMGMTMNVSNEDMVEIVRAMLQTLKDNPRMLSFLATQMGMTTDAQLAYMWDMLQGVSTYETEEEMRADNITIEQQLDELIADLDGKKLLDGDCVINVCVDEASMPVYMALNLPIFIEYEPVYIYEDKNEAEDTNGHADASHAAVTDIIDPVGETMVVEMVYSRQTVAQGVSHVVNLTVDGETLTADTLVNGSQAHIVLSVPEQPPVIIDAAVEGNAVTAKLTHAPDEETSMVCTFEGSYLYNETKYVLEGRFTAEETFIPAESEAPSHNGLTLPGFEKYKPKARTDTLALSIRMDYDLNGVNFTGVTDIVVDINDVHIALQANSSTSDPEQSIASENVIRPAELDEAAFANWFVGVINTLESWLGNLMMALPESLLNMLMYSGM